MVKFKLSSSSALMSKIPLHEGIELLADIGYYNIEIWSSRYYEQLGNGMTSKQLILESLKKTNLKTTIHCPLRDEDGEQYNITSKDETLRKRSVEAFLKSIELANELNSELVVLHPGHTDKYDEVAYDEFRNLHVEAFKLFSAKARELDVKITVELMEARK